MEEAHPVKDLMEVIPAQVMMVVTTPAVAEVVLAVME
jgi:hypothetical protein